MQVVVDRRVGVPAEGSNHGRPDGEVGYETAIHDVDVDPVGLGADPRDLGCEVRIGTRFDPLARR